MSCATLGHFRNTNVVYFLRKVSTNVGGAFKGSRKVDEAIQSIIKAQVLILHHHVFF